MRVLLLTAALAPFASADLIFSAGFSDTAVLQRSSDSGALVYGFSASAAPVTVAVSGKNGKGAAVSYTVAAVVQSWTGGTDVHPGTPPPPPHGSFIWRAELQPSDEGINPAGGGALVITASNGAVNGTATISDVTYGDVKDPRSPMISLDFFLIESLGDIRSMLGLFRFSSAVVVRAASCDARGGGGLPCFRCVPSLARA